MLRGANPENSIFIYVEPVRYEVLPPDVSNDDVPSSPLKGCLPLLNHPVVVLTRSLLLPVQP